MTDPNGLIPISAIRASIEEATARAERLEAEAALQRGVVAALESLIAKGESVQLETRAQRPAEGGRHSNGSGTHKARTTTHKPNRPIFKAPLACVLSEILKEHPEGITKGEVSKELERRGRQTNVSALTSVLSQDKRFVNEKLGPNYFLWKYAGESSGAPTQPQEQQEEQVRLGLDS
ncbi:MAG: hypothetical protein KY445_08555 [Armatimonadetes bacterium]|nr:hypothetical protein [Armatimonadota bacterium]